jgi:Spy/CpxP family protein refolding chaperone
MKINQFKFYHNYHIIILCCFLSFSFLLIADEKESHKSNYMGEINRLIKSLSAKDIEDLTLGNGMGLAKAAELNGYPGPKHVLEMQEQLFLEKEQLTSINQIFEEMKSQAKSQGQILISLEKELNDYFSNTTITNDNLEKISKKIAEAKSNLRYIHLSAHIKTTEILSKNQIKKYNQLRGYADNPCEKIPDGHNKEMWMLHNECN